MGVHAAAGAPPGKESRRQGPRFKASTHAFSALRLEAPSRRSPLAESLGPQRNWLAITALATGWFPALGTYMLQWYSAFYGHPFVVGGKPLQSAPAFMLVTFAADVLSAVLVAVFGMIFGNRLPPPGCSPPPGRT